MEVTIADYHLTEFSNSFFESSTSSDISWSAFTANDNSYDLPNNRLPSSTNNLPKCLLFISVRSIRNNIDEFQALLSMDSFDVIAFTETWLDVNFEDKELGLEGYCYNREKTLPERIGFNHQISD